MLKKEHRLRAGRDFRRVYARGRAYASSLFVLHLMRTRDERRRIGFAISRKIGRAVLRNRLKRRLSECCRRHFPRLEAGFDAVFVARKPAATADTAALEHALDTLFADAGVLAEAPVCGSE